MCPSVSGNSLLDTFFFSIHIYKSIVIFKSEFTLLTSVETFVKRNASPYVIVLTKYHILTNRKKDINVDYQQMYFSAISTD